MRELVVRNCFSRVVVALGKRPLKTIAGPVFTRQENSNSHLGLFRNCSRSGENLLLGKSFGSRRSTQVHVHSDKRTLQQAHARSSSSLFVRTPARAQRIPTGSQPGKSLLAQRRECTLRENTSGCAHGASPGSFLLEPVVFPERRPVDRSSRGERKGHGGERVQTRVPSMSQHSRSSPAPSEATFGLLDAVGVRGIGEREKVLRLR
jgi:hypothetical protein